MPDSSQDITILLHRWHKGDQDAAEEIFKRLLPDLKKFAARVLNRGWPGISLERTELVDEGFMKLAAANRVVDWRDRGHFFAIYNIRLRSVLLDLIKKKKMTPELLSLEDLPEAIVAGRNRLELRLAVSQLLDELEKESPVTYAILVARIYFGYEMKEIAENLALPLRTVERRLHEGRVWLFKRLTNES